ncbi:hypothetical protein [Rhizobium ruizarguesonis]|uniref:hypothetical protein n=1 Tax=Rhizobium ruizarguesonis TaxID=2081791 RepID=UPI0010324BD7|nr:hypothetical protein [Rhizobium ruizarguesonis]TAY75303.1 hypothetical protein ELH84_16205 [Rhizobium ruizarguesonis]
MEKIHLFIMLILLDKIFKSILSGQKVKFVWTIGIFLALIRQKGTALRGLRKSAVKPSRNRFEDDQEDDLPARQAGGEVRASIGIPSSFRRSRCSRREGAQFGRRRPPSCPSSFRDRHC